MVIPAVNEAKLESELVLLVKAFVSMLVDDAAAVKVSSGVSEGVTSIHVEVLREDFNKVIGKQGRTARALRTIVGAASIKLHHRISLEILESE